MEITKKNIDVQKVVIICNEGALIDSRIVLSPAQEEIGNVLAVTARPVVSRCDCDFEAVQISGENEVTIIYVDKKGLLSSMISEHHFTHRIENSDITSSMKAIADICAENVSYRVENRNSVFVNVTTAINCRAYSENEVSIISEIDDAEVEMLSQNFELEEIENIKTVKSYSKFEIPTTTVYKNVLFADACAEISQTNLEPDRVIAEGKVKAQLVLEAESGEPEYICETFDFAEIIHDDEVSTDSKVIMLCDVDRISAEIFEGKIEISCVVLLSSICIGKEEVSVITDLYSTGEKSVVTETNINSTELSQPTVQTKNIRLDLLIPPSSPEISVGYFALGNAQVLNVEKVAEKFVVSGLLNVTVCYKTSDDLIKSYKSELPFETELSAMGYKDREVCVTACIEKCDIIGSGSNVELKTMVCFNISGCMVNEVVAVSDVATVETTEENEQGIVIYFADGKENLWEVAKRFRVNRNTLKAMNPDIDEKIPKGTKMLLVKS